MKQIVIILVVVLVVGIVIYFVTKKPKNEPEKPENVKDGESMGLLTFINGILERKKQDKKDNEKTDEIIADNGTGGDVDFIAETI